MVEAYCVKCRAKREMKNPKEIIPRTMFYGISIIAIIYLGANLMYHTVMGLEGVRNSNIVASDTASILFGNFGAAIISMIVIISATGSINGTMMSASRLYYATVSYTHLTLPTNREV